MYGFCLFAAANQCDIEQWARIAARMGDGEARREKRQVRVIGRLCLRRRRGRRCERGFAVDALPRATSAGRDVGLELHEHTHEQDRAAQRGVKHNFVSRPR